MNETILLQCLVVHGLITNKTNQIKQITIVKR